MPHPVIIFPIIYSYLIIFLKFFLSYLLFSRAVSMPVGIALGINRYFVFGLVFGLDLLQIPLFYYIFRYGTERIRWLSFLNNKLPTQEKINKSFLGRIMQSLGNAGIIIIAFLPSFGGMASAVFIAFTLRLNYRRSLIYLAVGSLLGCLLVFGGTEGIIFLFRQIFK